jgi:hypothetical protein
MKTDSSLGVNEAHTSSSSGVFERENVKYKKESEIKTFKAQKNNISSSDPYPATTIKIARNMKRDTKYSAKFSLNILKIAREENNYKINQKLTGNESETISTKND